MPQTKETIELHSNAKMDIHNNNNNASILIAKLTSMAILTACSFLLGIAPLTLTRAPTTKSLLISLLLCFGGGVLLYTTFIHLQPEVRDGFHRLALNQNDLPLSEIVLCAGFFIVYLIDELAHALLTTGRHSTTKNTTTTTTTPPPPNNLNRSVPHKHFAAVPSASLSGVLAVLALSFHAVFEGLAVGLEVASAQRVWYLCAAIATHKFVIAFCMGVELVRGGGTRVALVLALMATFALVTPLGIGIGILLSATSAAVVEGEATCANVTAVVLQGMAAGTLLYVVFFEVLARERAANGHANGLCKLTAIVAGFCVMLALQVATGHEHSHSDSHDDSEHNHMATAARALSGAAVSAVTSQPPDDFTHTY